MDFSINHFYLISWKSDDPFYKIFAFINGVNKYDHIVTLRLMYRYESGVNKGDLYTVNEFIDKDMITNQKCGLHRFRGYFKCLDNKRSYKQRKQDSYSCSFSIFPERTLFFEPISISVVFQRFLLFFL